MTYMVSTVEFGTLLKEAGSIKQAREWAAKAFPGKVLGVSRWSDLRSCDWCGSSICCCEVRPRKS